MRVINNQTNSLFGKPIKHGSKKATVVYKEWIHSKFWKILYQLQKYLNLVSIAKISQEPWNTWKSCKYLGSYNQKLRNTVNIPVHTTKMKENSEKYSKKFIKKFWKSTKKNIKMSGSKSTNKINKKLKKYALLCTFVQLIKIGNPKENAMCENTVSK